MKKKIIKRKLQSLVNAISSSEMKKKFPDCRVGSILCVDVNIQEGDKKRVQSFTGLFSNYHKAGVNSTITVARFSKGIRVTRTFQINAADVNKITVVRSK